jgi:hypothetical protein
MDRGNLGALLWRKPANFAWYTNDADNRVDHAYPFGVADVLVAREAGYIFTDNIEATRMREEQAPGFGIAEQPLHEDEGSRSSRGGERWLFRG